MVNSTFQENQFSFEADENFIDKSDPVARNINHFIERVRSTLLRGGRMTKYKGQVASYAPSLGISLYAALGPVLERAAEILGSSVSARALAVALMAAAPVALTGTTAHAACTETAAGSGIWDCTGANVVTLAPTSAAGGDLVVTTTAPFSVNAAAGNGFDLLNVPGDVNITFTDNNASGVAGFITGIYADNLGTGATSITTTGVVTGGTQEGINAANAGTSLTIDAQNTVTGGDDGIFADNNGSGVLSITTQAVTGTAGNGINANNSAAGTSLIINAQGTVLGGDEGIDARNFSNGGTTITTQAITSTGSDAVFASNAGTFLSIDARAVVSGDNDGIDARNYGIGALTMATQVVTGTNGDGIYAHNDGISLTIVTQGAVLGNNYGIAAYHYGLSALSITTQAVTGTNSDGIYSINNNGTSLTVNAQGAVVGDDEGIKALNHGSGALSISTQAVTGTGDDGIYAYNSATGTSLSITTQSAVTGGDDGIDARNNGTAGLTITANGNVTGQARQGIYAFNSANDVTASMVINQAAGTVTTGALNGIFANNFGGSLTINALGTTIGTANDGIYADNNVGTTDLTITANTVTGGTFGDGIDARNNGTGALSITTTGAVNGTNGIGIYARNTGTNLTIDAQGDVTARFSGIEVYNYGSGVTSITTTGVVTATNGTGIYAYSGTTTTGLTITTGPGAVTGGDNDGIEALNDGTGALMITTSGAVTGNGAGDDGIYARNASTATSLTILTGPGVVTGNQDGIDARNNGTAGLTITANGNVTGNTGHGINAYNSANDVTASIVINQAAGTVTTGLLNGISASNYGGSLTINALGTSIGTAGIGIAAGNNVGTTDLIITAYAASGAQDGILVRNLGTGATSITATGAITGTSYDGISAANTAVATGAMTITTGPGAVTGGYDGINARNFGTGVLSVTTNGTVTGGTGYGIATQTMLGGMTVITVNSGSTVSSTTGLGIFNDVGNSTTTINTGGAVNGAIRLNDGSDNLVFAGGDFSGVTIFDGGDDTGVADTFIDTLTFQGSSGALTGANVLNWENLVIGSGSTITFVDNMITVGNGTAGTGLSIMAGGTLNAAGGLTLTGNMTNTGIVTMQDGATGDVMTVNGDYDGTGELRVDVDFATDTSDILAVNGDITGGTTIVSVNNVTGGTITGNDVLVVDVSGTSNASDFALAAPVAAGAFTYDLSQSGSDWLMSVSGFNPATPTYEAYPQILSDLNQLSSLRRRISNRTAYGNNGAMKSRQSFDGSGNGTNNTQQTAIWARIEGAHSSAGSPVSTTASSYDFSRWRMQAGLDGQLPTNGNGLWIIGANGFYGGGKADIFSTTGNGSISTQTFGLGLTATWFGIGGLYVDGQAQFSWFSSDLSNAASGALINSNDGRGQAFSIEVGKKITMSDGWTITPQAQLMTSSIKFDTFAGPVGELVSLNDGNSVLGRLGITFDNQQSWNADDGSVLNSSFYALANIYSQFSGQSSVNVSGVNFTNLPDQWFGEVGLGGSINLGNLDDNRKGNKTVLFGEVSIATSFENFGNSNQYRGVAGVRINF